MKDILEFLAFTLNGREVSVQNGFPVIYLKGVGSKNQFEEIFANKIILRTNLSLELKDNFSYLA